MNKTDILLQMMQQPQDYTAEEWQEILADEECRELYTLMSMTRSALDAASADEKTTDDVIDAEWQRLQVKSHTPLFTLHASVLKYAAMFVGILMLSGIAFAAIRIVTTSNHSQKDVETELTNNSMSSQPSVLSPQNSEGDSIPSVRLFENTPLDEMVSEIAHYYHLEADIQSKEAHELRLYYRWELKDAIESVMDDLNHFDRVCLTVEDDKMIVVH